MNFAVFDLDRDHLVVTQHERALDSVRYRLNISREPGLPAKGIFESAGQTFESLPRCINWHLVTVSAAEPSEIVEPENMIRVRVSIDDSVQSRDVCP